MTSRHQDHLDWSSMSNPRCGQNTEFQSPPHQFFWFVLLWLTVFYYYFDIDSAPSTSYEYLFRSPEKWMQKINFFALRLGRIWASFSGICWIMWNLCWHLLINVPNSFPHYFHLVDNYRYEVNYQQKCKASRFQQKSFSDLILCANFAHLSEVLKFKFRAKIGCRKIVILWG